MNFINIEKFKKWVKKNAKVFYDIQPYLDELEEKYCATGSLDYELSHFETKSGNPECYYYEVETKEIDDGECEPYYETTIIF